MLDAVFLYLEYYTLKCKKLEKQKKENDNNNSYGKFHRSSSGKLSFSTNDLNIYHVGSTMHYLQVFKIMNMRSKFASYNDLIFLKMR